MDLSLESWKMCMLARHLLLPHILKWSSVSRASEVSVRYFRCSSSKARRGSESHQFFCEWFTFPILCELPWDPFPLDLSMTLHISSMCKESGGYLKSGFDQSSPQAVKILGREPDATSLTTWFRTVLYHFIATRCRPLPTQLLKSPHQCDMELTSGLGYNLWVAHQGSCWGYQIWPPLRRGCSC